MVQYGEAAAIGLYLEDRPMTGGHTVSMGSTMHCCSIKCSVASLKQSALWINPLPVTPREFVQHLRCFRIVRGKRRFSPGQQP
jgi:hypothetical protein